MPNKEIILVPIKQKAAKDFVRTHHRHHKPPVGSIFQIGCSKNGELCGVIIIGRPVARMLDNGFTAEVTRCCTNGTKNVCSMLYAAAWRAARALGYKRLITYILESEKGTSLKAAGYKLVGNAAAGLGTEKTAQEQTNIQQNRNYFLRPIPDANKEK